MLLRWKGFLYEAIGAFVIGFAVLLLLSPGNGFNFTFGLTVPAKWLDIKTIFLSILLEAIPFVLLGVFFSALLQTFVTDDQVRRWTPKNPIVAIPFAALLGLVFPVCECAIIPIVRRLIQKGMPAHVGIVFMLAGPVVNPVVMAATYTAFPRDPEMVVYRTLLAFAVAIITGICLLLLVKGNPMKLGIEQEIRHEAMHLEKRGQKFSSTLEHAINKFFDMGKFLIFGALISAILQVYISRQSLIELGQTPIHSHLLMMGLGYVFSLCSEADAFIAASFATSFQKSSLLAFLVFGPMIDFKNTLMLLSSFRFSFVVKLIGIVSAIVLLLTILVPI